MKITSNEERESAKIGRFIAELREEMHITQKDLAKALQTSQSAVARMEAGEQNFSTGMLAKIGKALNRQIITLSTGAINFRIEGGHKLSGTVKTNTSKNSAVFLLCASLLNRSKTVLRNMPRIEEVFRIIEVLESIGVSVKWLEGNDLEVVPPAKIRLDQMNAEAAIRTRSVVMMIGPLAHLFPRFTLPHPGGCKLGKRTVLPHIYALERLGIQIKSVRGKYEISAKKPKPSEIVMYEAGDTATGNALMAAAGIPGTTVIKFASANYQVQDLCYYLRALGVEVEGIGTATLTVRGVSEINLPVTFAPTSDPIESMLFISIAATTNSSITITRCPVDFLELELLRLEKMGFKYEVLTRYKAENGFANLADIRTLPSRLIASEEKLHPLPSGNGINIDNLPFFVPIATQARGTTLIHDWVYENRAIYYMELAKLGAKVILADPHRVYVEGRSELKAAEVICPPALRPAVIILIGMLAAKGTSVLRNVYSINRGYEDLCNRLNSLGAKIKILGGI